MRALIRRKKFWFLFSLVLCGVLVWFVACKEKSEQTEIRVTVGPDTCDTDTKPCGTVEPYGTYYQSGGSFSIKATAKAGYGIAAWNVNGVPIENMTGDSYDLPVSGSTIAVIVNFKPLNVTPVAGRNALVSDPSPSCPTGNANTQEGGQETCWTLPYTQTSNGAGFALVFSNDYFVGKDKNPCDENVSITVEGSNTFVPLELIPILTGTDASKNQYFCNSPADRSTITISGTNTEGSIDFRPIAQKFRIKINRDVFHVTVDSSAIISNPHSQLKLADTEPLDPNSIPAQFRGCGQQGTIVQRMFDCSLLVTDFFQNPVSTALAKKTLAKKSNVRVKKSTTVDYNSAWFVVSCPAYGDNNTVLGCAWLTPVIISENPAVNPSQPTGLSLATIKGPSFSGPRLLFSGIMSDPTSHRNDYTFVDANGYEPLTNQCDTNNCYTASTPSEMGKWSRKTEPPVLSTICVPANPKILIGSSNMNIPWVVPSYPMLYLLTGGGDCANSTDGDLFSCNKTHSRSFGFNANAIKWFIGNSPQIPPKDGIPWPTFRADHKLWASSLVLWTGTMQGMLFEDSAVSSVNFAGTTAYLRCASTIWN